MLRSHIRRLAYLSLALFAACATNRRAPTRPDRVVVVDNRSFSDMNVYVVEGTLRQRIGTVPGLTTSRLKLPRNMSSGMRVLRFLVDPIGGTRTAMTQDITVGPEETITLTIPPG